MSDLTPEEQAELRKEAERDKQHQRRMMDQAWAQCSESWWTLKETCLARGFTEEQAMLIVCTMIKCSFGKPPIG